MAAIGGAAAIPYLHRRVDQEICSRIQSLFANHYQPQGLKPTIRSASLVEGEGILVRDILITEPGAEGPRADLLNVPELFLHCNTTLQELVIKEPEVAKISIRRSTIRFTRRSDGRWSASKLYPTPKFGHRSPPVQFENCVVEFFDPTKPRSSLFQVRDVNFTIDPPSLVTDESGRQYESRSFQGMLTCDYFRRVEFHGAIDSRSSAVTVLGTMEGLEISPALADALPEPFASQMGAAGTLRAEGKLNFELAYDAQRPTPLLYKVKGMIKQGRISDSRIPHTLTDLQADFTVDNNGLKIEDATAKSNQTTVRVSKSAIGFGENAPIALHVILRRLQLDPQLLNILPASMQRLWYRHSPTGEIDLDADLLYDGRQWNPDANVRCQSVSFLCDQEKFPYRLNYGQGTLDLKNERLTIDLSAYCGSQKIQIGAEVKQPLTPGGAYGSLEAFGEKITVDEALLRAIPEKPQQVARSLDPRGAFDFHYSAWRDRPGEMIHQHLILEPKRGSIRYEKFPYAVDNLTGRIDMIDKTWDFYNLEGTNGTARITGRGTFQPTLQGNQLTLDLLAKDVSLTEELRDALPPNRRQVWESLSPRGMVDLDSVHIEYLAESKQLHLNLAAKPHPDVTSIESLHFPYRIEKLSGTMVYSDGRVELKKMHGEHGGVAISSDGYCEFEPDGPWALHFQGLNAEQLPLDRDLILAMPERLRKAVQSLHPTNKISLRGDFDIFHNGLLGVPPQMQWDVTLGLLENSANIGLEAKNIWGNVKLKGKYDGQQVRCRGELALDSLFYKNIQFTQITGPIWIDDQKILFGTQIGQNALASASSDLGPAPTPRPLVAKIFDGGVLASDGWVALEAEPRYGFHAELRNADLSCAVFEMSECKQRLLGKVSASIYLGGVGSSRNAMTGSGRIALDDAYVYELPQMLRILKLLSIKTPDRNAFSNGTIDYRIEGEHIYLDEIDLKGDVISLRGKGDMDWQQNINLTFHTIIGHTDRQIPIMKDMFSEASRGIMTIRATGPIQDPTIEKIALPAVNQALQNMQDNRRQ